MNRRWRVRHSYPQPVVELVERLLASHDVRGVSRLLDIPASVIYRWRATRRIGRDARPAFDLASTAALVAQCDVLGFGFGERLRALASHPAHAQANAGAAVRAASAPRAIANGSSALPPTDSRNDIAVARAAQPDAAERPHSPERAAATGARGALDCRTERPARGVRRRLEAVRQMIDAQYFLDIDSHMLAETAGMSRHHFIRMFSGMFGVSPHQYLKRARIGAAKRLLLSSREPIDAIAVGVGFRSGSSLNRAFKQIEGASVSKYCHTAGGSPHDRRQALTIPAPSPSPSPGADAWPRYASADFSRL